MVEKFKPGNRFSDTVSIAAAAVEWQGLSAAQQALVIVEDGLPFLAGVPDLTARAEALLEAAESRTITGFTHNENGGPVPAEHIRLDRESVLAWVKRTNSRLPPQVPRESLLDLPDEQPERLLRAEEVWNRLGIGKSTFYRRVRSGEIERPHLDTPPRWRESYVDSLMSTRKAAADI